MSEKLLDHEHSPIYQLALKVYRSCAAAAPQIETRRLRGAMGRAALRLLQHVASGEASRTLRGRARWFSFAHIALSNLAAVVDAAWIGGEISTELRLRLRLSIAGLDSKLLPFLPTRAHSIISAIADPPSERDQRQDLPLKRESPLPISTLNVGESGSADSSSVPDSRLRPLLDDLPLPVRSNGASADRDHASPPAGGTEVAGASPP